MISAGVPREWMELDRRGGIVISSRIEKITRHYETRTATDADGHLLAASVENWLTDEKPPDRFRLTTRNGTLTLDHTYQSHMVIGEFLLRARLQSGPLSIP